MTRVYEELVDFIAGGSSADDVARFQPSEDAREKVAALIRKEKNGGLSAEEGAELGHYLQLEHVMRLAKAKARQRLAHE